MMMRPILITLLTYSLSACAYDNTPAATASEQAAWAMPVKQDANMYRIDDKLYRSEQPIADDSATIRALGIKSVVNLRFFDRDDDRTHLGGQGLTLVNKPLLSWRISARQIAETLFLIEQHQQQGPVLVHCYHGADRTGLISGMYRIIYQNWSIEAAKQEMLQGPYGFHSVWQNIAAMFNEQTVNHVRRHLNELRASQ